MAKVWWFKIIGVHLNHQNETITLKGTKTKKMRTIIQNVDVANFSDSSELKFKKNTLMSDFTLDVYYKNQRIAIINGVSSALQWTAKNGSNIPLTVIEKLERKVVRNLI